MNVEDIMTSEVRSCRPDETLDRVARAMWEGDFGCVPVVDASGVVIGMITDRDICMAAYLQGLPVSRVLASTAASREVFAVPVGSSIAQLEHVMRAHRVRRVPVVDGVGRLVGIVSLHDLARHYRGGWGRDATNADDLARTLSVISEPRALQQQAAE